MKISTQILSSIIGITILAQIILGSVAYWIILNDHEHFHDIHIQQMAKTLHNNLSVSALKINSKAYLEKLHQNFTTEESILLLNSNNKLHIAGIEEKYSSAIFEDVSHADPNNPRKSSSGRILINNKEFHWNSAQLDDNTELIFLESCAGYTSDSFLSVRLVTTSIIIMWVATWVGLILSHAISKSLNAKNKELEHQAFHDKLTGLPNRLLMMDRLEQTLLDSERRGNSFTLLLMDLDNFKDLNDTLGHHYGDELLQQFGKKIIHSLRKNDTFARLGGDEFAAILHDTDQDNALIIINKLLANMNESHFIKGTQIESKASIGVAIYPLHGSNSQILLQHADVAMYQAKNTRSGYAIYDRSFDSHSLRRLQLMNELRSSINNNHIHVFYQPMISQSDNRIVSVEALARWNHPKMGFVAPNEFIPVAEQTGLIRKLTRFVMRTALRDCKGWRGMGYDIRISINISPHCLQDASFPGNLQSIVKNSGIAAENVELEITETALMQDLKNTGKVLLQFYENGYKVSIDDFGTGFSSLEHLKELPVDSLKIDKTFVEDMNENDNDAAIVKSIIDLGHALKCNVIAEGVEDEKTRQKLIAFDVDVLQGYLFSKAIPSNEFKNWLHSSEWQVKMLA